MRNVVACLVVAILFHGCGGGEKMPQSVSGNPMDRVSAAAWERLAGKRIFFGHQSVGYDIVDGVGELLKERPGIRLTIVETSDPSRFDAPLFAHARVGRNGDPGSKCESFEHALDSGIGSRADIAFFKFCYVDVDRDTDLDRMFETYRETVRRVKSKYPRLLLAHVTVPLTTEDRGWKARSKALVKRILGRKDPNVDRERFNDRIRKEYGGKDPVFDLAAIESTAPSGEPVAVRYDGKSYPALYPGYTTDGGHLNRAGKRVVAERLLPFLAGLAGERE